MKAVESSKISKSFEMSIQNMHKKQEAKLKNGDRNGEMIS
jgi:hypothetical protein